MQQHQNRRDKNKGKQPPSDVKNQRGQVASKNGQRVVAPEKVVDVGPWSSDSDTCFIRRRGRGHHGDNPGEQQHQNGHRNGNKLANDTVNVVLTRPEWNDYYDDGTDLKTQWTADVRGHYAQALLTTVKEAFDEFIRDELVSTQINQGLVAASSGVYSVTVHLTEEIVNNASNKLLKAVEEFRARARGGTSDDEMSSGH